MNNIRTDLALETREMLSKDELDGVETKVERQGSELITHVRITNDNGVRLMGKAIGSYVTIEAPALRERDPFEEEAVIQILAGEIKKLAGDMGDDFTTLVVGLGNWNVTPDALGPKVIEKTMITRHISEYLPEQMDDKLRPICGISPGVLGLTGMETGEIVRSIVNAIHPDLVIVVDSLASRRTERISTTIQLTNTGIDPGSGIGNKRMALNSESLKAPVIAIGVPLVVYASTIARDILENMLQQSGETSEEYGESRLNNLVLGVLPGSIGDMVVTPKEIDVLVEDISRVIAGGLNLALHKDMDLEYSRRFMH